jgi:hypothetical protein
MAESLESNVVKRSQVFKANQILAPLADSLRIPSGQELGVLVNLFGGPFDMAAATRLGGMRCVWPIEPASASRWTRFFGWDAEIAGGSVRWPVRDVDFVKHSCVSGVNLR